MNDKGEFDKKKIAEMMEYHKMKISILTKTISDKDKKIDNLKCIIEELQRINSWKDDKIRELESNVSDLMGDID